jgi:hypothetical protein
MLRDERQLEEAPSMSRKGMRRSRSRYDGWTLAGRIDRCDGSLVPELKYTNATGDSRSPASISLALKVIMTRGRAKGLEELAGVHNIDNALTCLSLSSRAEKEKSGCLGQERCASQGGFRMLKRKRYRTMTWPHRRNRQSGFFRG